MSKQDQQQQSRHQMKRSKSNMRGKQGRKDSGSKRVNFDNERESKFIRDEEKAMKDMAKHSTDNDIRWYARNKALLESAGRFSFYNVVGNILPLENGNTTTTNKYAVPGILTLCYTPSVGPLNSKALKQAQDSMHSYIVHANSRNESYDGADIMMLVLAGVEVFSAIAAGIRAYGVMQMYDEENFYKPAAILAALGFNSTDLKSNYSRMWYDLNRLIAASKQIWVPNEMPVMERRFWMNTNIYMDGTSNKSQMYAYKQSAYYQYNATIDTVGGGLEKVSGWTATSQMTWANYVAMVDGMLDALINDSDRGLIFGDILKAYGSAALYTIDELPLNYVTPISYNEEVLTQIENATICRGLPDSFNQQADGQIYAKYSGTTALGNANSGAPNKVLINFHQKEQPTPEQVMIATRMSACGTTWVFGTVNSAQAIVNAQPMVCGTEYATAMIMYAYRQTGSAAPVLAAMPLDNYTNATGVPTFEYMYAWSAFDWSPHLYKTNMNSTLDPTAPIQYEPGIIFADYENYTFMDSSDLEKLHTTALFSEFGIPIDNTAPL